jgi:hypothetical protein
VQVTDAGYDAQHAKFFHGGRSLVVTALQQPGRRSRGIACIDISRHL